MSMRQQALRYGQRRLARRLGRAVPFLGTAIALAMVGSAIRRKGLLGGVTDSTLNAIPFLGGFKIAAETIRGRDFIRERDEHHGPRVGEQGDRSAAGRGERGPAGARPTPQR
jgi:hypothetical protein